MEEQPSAPAQRRKSAASRREASTRPTATITSEIDALGWPLWLLYVAVFTLTLVIGARLIVAVLQVAIATRRRRAHHRMLVDLVSCSRDRAPAVCTKASGLRILDVEQPLAYCLPGVRSRVVVSQGTLTTLEDTEIAAILGHEQAHLRARHDLAQVVRGHVRRHADGDPRRAEKGDHT